MLGEATEDAASDAQRVIFSALRDITTDLLNKQINKHSVLVILRLARACSGFLELRHE